MSKARDLANLLSDGSSLADGVVAASEVTGLSTVATSGDFTDLSNQPAAFDPSTLASVAVSGSFNDLSNQPSPFDPSTLATVATSGAYSALSGKPSLGTASAQATGAFATAAQGTKANTALQPALAGVTSVDATTAAAFGAAGVGGDDNATLLTTVAINSNTSLVSLTLASGYRRHIIKWQSMISDLGNSELKNVEGRFLTSGGGTPLGNIVNNRPYITSDTNGVDFIYLAEIGNQASSPTNVGVALTMIIDDANDSARVTSGSWIASGRRYRFTSSNNGGNQNAYIRSGSFSLLGNQATPTFRMSLNTGHPGGSFHSTSGDIQVWGVK